MGKIIITKKSPERNGAGSGQGQGIKKPWHIGQHPDRAAGFPEGITKRILAVPEPGLRSTADDQQNIVTWAAVPSMGAAGVTVWQRKEKTGKSSGSGR